MSGQLVSCGQACERLTRGEMVRGQYRNSLELFVFFYLSGLAGNIQNDLIVHQDDARTNVRFLNN